MLLPEVWDALDYLLIEPPAHGLLRGVAKFFGYQFQKAPEVRRRMQRRRGHAEHSLMPYIDPGTVEKMQSIAGAPIPMPAHLAKLPYVQKIREAMAKKKEAKDAG